jgi:trimeric autotransporter adhesin
MNPLTQSKNTTILPVLIALTLGCFGLSPQARAVCQEGCDLVNDNTFLGDDALLNNTTGRDNTAVGSQALSTNVTGGSNTAVGHTALEFSDHNFNTAVGAGVLTFNNADFNTAVGAGAMLFNDTGTNNTAMGFFAAQINIDGSNNAAFGFEALRRNRQGNGNTAVGNLALSFCRGHNNTAIGESAGINIDAGSNNILLGSKGQREDNNTIRIGTTGTQTATFIAGISGATVPTGVAVIVDSSGHLGTTTSSARFKKNIQPMNKTSEAIFSLKPVTFRYKKEHDPDGIPQFGLVAEEVEKVNPDLVARDADGKAYTVRYDAVNAMLLNEFLKQHNEFVKEHQKVQRLEAALAAVNERLKAQDAKIDKVNAKVELTKPAPQVVVNDQ